MTYWERLLAEYVGGGDSPISPTLIAKSITTNGTYNAVDDEADGYSSVSVNVPNTSMLKGTLPLTFKTSEEQLRDWTIYGSNYEHTYSAEGTLPLTFTSHTAGNAGDWTIYGNAEGVGERTKNLLEINETTDTIRDVTFTVNKSAGTITTSGTATDGSAIFKIYIDTSLYGDFRFAGCANTGTSSTFYIDAYDETTGARCKAWDGTTNSVNCYNTEQRRAVQIPENHICCLRIIFARNTNADGYVFMPMLIDNETTQDTLIPYGYQVPITVSQTGQTDKNYDIFIGDSPLTEGETASKTSTGIDIAAMAGSNTITTGLYNKPEMSITGFDYVGVGELINDGWQIPLTVSDGTNTATVNVPIDAPLTSTDSISNVVDIPTYVGTNTIDTTLVEPVTADIVYVGANSTLINKTINQNGTYFAYSDNANGYNSVAVAVPNTYTNEDESKVVHNGELVAQTTASVTTNGIVDTTAIRSVSVNVPTAGSVTGDVRFLDYDGTVVQAYSKSDFASLTALPANPTHEGLTAQGWNWSLEDAKTYVAEYDKLDIGQMYITNDGKTRLYVTLDDGRLNPTLAIAVDGSCDVDWGDGTTHDTLTGMSLGSWVSVSHRYAIGGDYVIALTVTGSFAFDGDLSGGMLFCYNDTPNDNRSKGYRNILRAVELGDGITDIYNSAFRNYYALSSITIPNSVTNIDGGAFYSCYALSSVTIPNNVTRVTISVFDTCYALSSITIPNSVTEISSNAFRNCYALLRATIPNSVTSIGNNVFYNCYALLSVTVPNSVTDIGSNVFYNCYALSNIAIPDDITSISNYAFYSCTALSSITIPDSVTSITTGAFYNCTALSSITIPSDVASIGSSAFYQCYGLGYIKFTSATPPTVANSNTFASVPTDCTIYVPTGSLADYISAQYYPSYSSYTYTEY